MPGETAAASYVQRVVAAAFAIVATTHHESHVCTARDPHLQNRVAQVIPTSPGPWPHISPARDSRRVPPPKAPWTPTVPRVNTPQRRS